MYPQIIKCPNCHNLFRLNHKPSKTFCCQKCQYMAPFDEIMKQNDPHVTKPEQHPANVSANTAVETGEATKVVNFGEKTMLVPGLQPQTVKTATLIIAYKGVNLGKVKLPSSGNFNLGRRSSDSMAHIKLAPDMTMSRVHAAMRVTKSNDGSSHYQITTIKPENPVYVNGAMIGKGKIYTLKSGDRIQLGDTILTFKLD